MGKMSSYVKGIVMLALIFFAWGSRMSALVSAGEPAVKPGIEMLFDDKDNMKLIEGKKVGLITNPTGIDHNFKSTIDILADYPGCKLLALFGPEHGIRGDFFGGAKVGDSVDKRTGVKIYSLYGSGSSAPSQEVLKTLDVLMYDIQDIGVRPYTYITTMMASMEAAKTAGIKFVVLDRPEPMGGDVVSGPVLEPSFKSAIGYYTIPYTYGLTPGELAKLYNAEAKIGADLTVIKMKGWKRGMLYPETGLPWVPPSTHICRWDTSIFCAITGGMGELNTVNEGVGYTLPFEIAGAPFIDGTALTEELNSRNIPGVRFRPISYQPKYYAFQDKNCSGVHIYLTDYKKIDPFVTGLHIMDAILKLYPDQKILDAEGRVSSFNKAMGTDKIKQMLIERKPVGEIVASYTPELANYMSKRKNFLLY
jgi:uncharacterized protein YbbC (DUF1343 family)